MCCCRATVVKCLACVEQVNMDEVSLEPAESLISAPVEKGCLDQVIRDRSEKAKKYMP